MSQFKSRLGNLITKSGGIIEDDLFVIKPGVMITEVTENTKEATELFDLMHCNHGDDYLQSAEFKGRITYLSFKDQSITEEESLNFHDRMINEAKHLSIYAGTHVTFLIAGCTVETCLEMCAHKEATIARLTSSKTMAMCDNFYRVQGESKDIQKKMIRDFVKLREENKQFWDKKGSNAEMLNTEFFNMLNLGCKCNALTFTISIKDLHKLLIGRMTSFGNETEVQEVCSLMCELAHKRYPLIIRDPSFYRKLDDNGAKLTIN